MLCLPVSGAAMNRGNLPVLLVVVILRSSFLINKACSPRIRPINRLNNKESLIKYLFVKSDK